MTDEFGNPIIEERDEFGNAVLSGEAAPETKSSVLAKAGDLLKTGGKAALRGLDWLSHLGQPQAAKDLVNSIATDPASAPKNPEAAGQLPSWMESMGMAAPGASVPTLPPGVDPRPAAAAAVDMATSPMSYLGAISKLPMVAGAMTKAGKIPEAGITRLSSELTGVSPPALEMASTGAGRAALETAAGQQGAIGKSLVDAVDNFEHHIPEAKQVAKAVKDMPPVDINPAIEALQKASPKYEYRHLSPEAQIEHLSPDQRLVAGKIDSYVEYLKTHAKSNPGGVPAEKALDIRRIIDSPIDFATGLPNPKEVQGALFQARTALKNGLISSAKKSNNPAEYTKSMETWAEKLHILDDVKNAALGAGNDYSKQSRATFFVNGLFGKGVTAGQKQELIGKLDHVFGSDFLEQSKNARYAAEIGDGGKAAFLPVQHTGRAALGAGVGHYLGDMMGHGTIGAVLGGTAAALSSPALATRVAIPASRIPPYLLRAIANHSPALSAAGASAAQLPPYLQRPE